MGAMGTFIVGVKVEKASNRSRGLVLPKLLVTPGLIYVDQRKSLETIGIKKEKRCPVYYGEWRPNYSFRRIAGYK